MTHNVILIYIYLNINYLNLKKAKNINSGQVYFRLNFQNAKERIWLRGAGGLYYYKYNAINTNIVPKLNLNKKKFMRSGRKPG